ncbi:MAG: hypothetical protein V1772_04425 [Chloroflexota bacterium]
MLMVAAVAVASLSVTTLAQSPQVQITAPEMGAEVRGRVPIMGSASIGSFQFYKVEFGVGPNPAQWAVIGDLHRQAVVNGQLEVWDTTVVPDGVYTLQLQAVRQDGNWESFFVRGVTVANKRPAATATAEVTNTPRVLATLTAEPTRTPTATPTEQRIAPTRGAMPTPTPTLSRPILSQPLPVDPKNWGQAFVFGAASMGAVFVLLGIVFGIRRLF